MLKAVTWLLLWLAGPLAAQAAGSAPPPAVQENEPATPRAAAPPVDPVAREEQLRAALRLSPEDARLHARLGEVLMEQGRPQDALASYREAVRLEPGSVELRHQLAEAALAIGSWAEAEAGFRAAIQLDPSRPALFTGLGEALRMQERGPEAADAYRRALRLDPADPRARQALAELDAARRADDARRSAGLLQRVLTLVAAVPLTLAGLALVLPCAGALLLLLRVAGTLLARRLRAGAR